jgi:transcriptional regulator with XRE-family HTH domain
VETYHDPGPACKPGPGISPGVLMTTRRGGAADRTVTMTESELEAVVARAVRAAGVKTARRGGGGRALGREPGGPVDTFWAKVQRAMQRQGKTRADLAEGIGRSSSRITKWLGSEDGATPPSGAPAPHEVLAIAEYLGVSLRYLCDPDMDRDPGEAGGSDDPALEEAYEAVRLLRDPALAKARLLGTAPPPGSGTRLGTSSGHTVVPRKKKQPAPGHRERAARKKG